MALEQIGAYYQCFKNKQSLNFVLNNFRKIYPESNIVLVNDGGDDFLEESIKYNCNYIFDKKLNTKKNLIFEDLQSIKNFIKRISSNIYLIKEDFFILLEDDVFVIKQIESELKFDVNGCNKNEFFSKKLSDVIKSKNKNIKDDNIFYGSFGGCVLRTHFFKDIFKNTEKIDYYIQIFYENSNLSDCASDKILSYLCLINNGTIGHYDGLCETWYPDYKERYDLNNIEVLHQYKIYY